MRRLITALALLAVAFYLIYLAPQYVFFGAAALMASQPYYNAHYWDYVDGASIIYLLGATNFLLARANERGLPIRIALGGFFAAAAATTNVFNIVLLPAHDEADEICNLMLAQLLARRGYCAHSISVEKLAGEMLDECQSVCHAPIAAGGRSACAWRDRGGAAVDPPRRHSTVRRRQRRECRLRTWCWSGVGNGLRGDDLW